MPQIDYGKFRTKKTDPDLQVTNTMPFLSAMLLALSALSLFSLTNFSAEWADVANTRCLSLIPQNARHSEIYQALICGSRVTEGELKSLLRQVGLIHLFVVSGAHLVFLDRLLQRILPVRESLFKSSLISFILFGYAHITLLNAPVLRSFFSQFLKTLDRAFELNLTSLDRLKVSVALTLFVRPELWNSFSLLLSAAATLALSTAAPNRVLQAVLVYVLMCFFLTSLGAPGPAAILFNLMFTPVFAYFYFPITWLLVPLPFIHPFVDSLWSFVFLVFEAVQTDALPANGELGKQPPWHFIAAILFVAELYRLHRQKKQMELSKARVLA